MRRFTLLLAFLASLALVSSAGADAGAPGQKKAAKKKVEKKKVERPVKGTVVEVKKDEIIVKGAGKKGKERAIKLGGETKFVKAAGKKKTPSTPIKAEDVAKGATVTVTLKGGSADTVTIAAARKGKKANPAK
jgi:hypothetical protein